MKKFFEKILEPSKVQKPDAADSVKTRKSCRNYHKKKVPFEIIFEILNTSLNYPCSGNILNTNLIYVEDKNKINKIADLCCEQLWISESSDLVIVLRENREVVHSYPEFGKKYSLQATSACIQNILILANHFGLGSCWVLACDEEAIKEIIGAGENYEIDAIIPIGYAKSSNETKTKSCPYAKISFEKLGNRQRI